MIFTCINDIDIAILKHVDIKSLTNVSVINKQALQLCTDQYFWIEKFNNDHIFISQYRPVTFNDWIIYYQFGHYGDVIDLNKNNINKLVKANLYAKNLMLLCDLEKGHKKYNLLYFEMDVTALNQTFYQATSQYYDVKISPLIVFKYTKHQYHILFFDLVYYIHDEEDEDEEEDDEYIHNEMQFIKLLTLIIYDKSYINITDVYKMSYMEEKSHDKRLGMWRLIHYLNKNKLLNY